MKMIYNGTPVNSMKVKHYELSTNDATLKPSDMQAGVTAYAKGRKVTGTGKAFSFATYGKWKTNESNIIPMVINTIQIGCTDYPVRMIVPMNSMIVHDFTIPQTMAEVTIDGVVYPMIVSVQDGEFLISCEKTINLQLFMGKDEYV